MDTLSEEVMARSEAEIEKHGIEFKLEVSKISEELYSELFSVMMEYIGQFTDTEVKYIGDWDITIHAKDVEFEGGK